MWSWGSINVCRYAAEQLTWLATQSAGSGNQTFLAQLQQNIDLCDKNGDKNSSVAPDEDLVSFAEIVGIAQDADEVDGSVDPLVDG